MGHADCLSRLPLPKTPNEVPIGETILLMENIRCSPLDSGQIKLWTARDPVLSHTTIIVTGPNYLRNVLFHSHVSFGAVG